MPANSSPSSYCLSIELLMHLEGIVVMVTYRQFYMQDVYRTFNVNSFTTILNADYLFADILVKLFFVQKMPITNNCLNGSGLCLQASSNVFFFNYLCILMCIIIFFELCLLYHLLAVSSKFLQTLPTDQPVLPIVESQSTSTTTGWSIKNVLFY